MLNLQPKGNLNLTNSPRGGEKKESPTGPTPGRVTSSQTRNPYHQDLPTGKTEKRRPILRGYKAEVTQKSNHGHHRTSTRGRIGYREVKKGVDFWDFRERGERRNQERNRPLQGSEGPRVSWKRKKPKESGDGKHICPGLGTKPTPSQPAGEGKGQNQKRSEKLLTSAQRNFPFSTENVGNSQMGSF